MFKHILVPLDGSQLSESTLPVAAFLAAKLHAMVTLIHVIERNAPRDIHGQKHLRNEEEATAYLKNMSLRAFPQGVQVDCHVHAAEVDNVAESIVMHKGEFSYDLIIMCSHGRGKALHLLMGCIAQKVISMGTIPVLVTHPGDKEDASAYACKAILVPLDGDPEHEQALPVSVELARACEATLHLAMVIPSFGTLSGQMTATSKLLPGTTSEMLEMFSQNAGEYLESQLQKLKNQGLAISTHVLRGDPAEVIVESALESQVDLVVLATHGKSGMEAFWEGSMTNKVVSQSKVPLLLVPVKKS